MWKQNERVKGNSGNVIKIRKVLKLIIKEKISKIINEKEESHC